MNNDISARTIQDRLHKSFDIPYEGMATLHTSKGREIVVTTEYPTLRRKCVA